MKFSFITFFALGFTAHAALAVKISQPKSTGSKSAIKLTIKNTFTEKVESARATMFLLDDKGKVVGQSVKWVIGGAKSKPALEPDATNTFHFVVTDSKPFAKVNVLFSRIILENGKLADPIKDVEIVLVSEEEKK